MHIMNECLMNVLINILRVGDKGLIRIKLSAVHHAWGSNLGSRRRTVDPYLCMGSIPTVSHLPSAVSSTQINKCLP